MRPFLTPSVIFDVLLYLDAAAIVEGDMLITRKDASYAMEVLATT
jgi:hypothetical protein